MRAELNIEGQRARRWTVRAAALLLALVAGLVSIAVSGAWNAGFSGADEPAHFLNGWFVSLYLRDAVGTDPMAVAAEFYLHYPKISIGHWPPAYYALLSPFLLVLPPTPQTAFALNLLISSLPALLASLLLARVERPAVALTAAFLVALTPVAAEGYAFFMLDQAVAAAALGATMLWLSHVERPAWRKALGFGLAAALAVLIKGNGWLLLFVPPLHLLLTGRWRILAEPAPWAAAVLAAAIVGPWYWLTAGISADGFNHRPGAAYALEALGFNLAALAANLGLGLALAGWGIASAWRARSENPRLWNAAAGCLSLVLATLLIQSLVPVDLDARYMAPALPPLVVLALIGASSILPDRRHLVLAGAAILVAVPGIAHLAAREPKIGLRLDEAAAAIGPRPSAWVIDGSTGAEGAFIAAMAVRDPDLRSYAIRSSRLLAASDFMGSDYRVTVSPPADILAKLERLGVEGVVVARIGGAPAFPHSALLRRALLSPGSRYRLVATLPHRGRPGVTEIYRSAGPVRLNEPAIRALGLPKKAGTLIR
jgi:hypothetical protein